MPHGFITTIIQGGFIGRPIILLLIKNSNEGITRVSLKLTFVWSSHIKKGRNKFLFGGPSVGGYL